MMKLRLKKCRGGNPLKLIETDRLVLRQWKSDDYLDFHEFVSDERVAKCAGSFALKDIEESKNNIELYISSNQSYAIVLKSENKVIGSIGMDDVSPDKELKDLAQRYIGYTINSKYWGKGYAPEAFMALVKYLFEEQNIDLIWSSHLEFNLQSKRVIEKCGLHYRFERDRTVRALGNRVVKEAYYNLSRGEYIR